MSEVMVRAERRGPVEHRAPVKRRAPAKRSTPVERSTCAGHRGLVERRAPGERSTCEGRRGPVAQTAPELMAMTATAAPTTMATSIRMSTLRQGDFAGVSGAGSTAL